VLLRALSSIVRAAVTAYRTEVEAGRIVPEHDAPECGEIVAYNVRVGDDLYQWLRVTAFDARTSINALGIAALARAHADYAAGTTTTDPD